MYANGVALFLACEIQGLTGGGALYYRNNTINRNKERSVIPFDDPRSHRLAELCKALSHPARVGILNHLLMENRCICGDLVAVLPLAQSTVSQHLKVLKAAGLVQGEVEGPKTCYCVDPGVLEELKALVGVMGAKHRR
jgi:ArsR family transcriptional regulator